MGRKRYIDPYYFTEEWRETRLRVLDRDGRICQYCGEPGCQADHVVPRSFGGRDTISNLVCCCPRCNKLLKSQYFTTKREKRAWIQSQLNGTPFRPLTAKGKATKRGLYTGMDKHQYRAALETWPTPNERNLEADRKLQEWLDSQPQPPP